MTVPLAAGVFTENIDCPFAYIEHRTYVHQRYIRLLVTDIYAKRKVRVSNITRKVSRGHCEYDAVGGTMADVARSHFKRQKPGA